MELLISVLPVVFTGLSTFLVWYGQQIVKANKSTKSALKVLMRHEMRLMYEKWSEKCYITIEAAGEFDEIYDIYTNLGGNGKGTEIKKQIDLLERRSK